MQFTALEICAGGGGQAIGLHRAKLQCVAALELDPHACETLRINQIAQQVIHEDLRGFSAKPYQGVDLVAGGVPCPPFSKAGKQLGKEDDRDLFPEAIRIIGEAKPRAVMLENVPGFAEARFQTYRTELQEKLAWLGYSSEWRILQASDFGVPQLRPRFLLVAMKPDDMEHFRWPLKIGPAPTVGDTLRDLMGANGWLGAEPWAANADKIAPTVVGGSKLHGGPDLGPTRAKKQWRDIGVDGMGIANEAPSSDRPLDFIPKLTVRMVARIQSFPDSWNFAGGKTAQYRQVGNAFPPKVAYAVASAIRRAMDRSAENASIEGLAFEQRLCESPGPNFVISQRRPVSYRKMMKA